MKYFSMKERKKSQKLSEAPVTRQGMQGAEAPELVTGANRKRWQGGENEE